jgi:hypothetical protein
MHLITPLVAGIAGGGNGTAEIYVRGTSSRPTCYTDPDGGATWSSATILLDAYGSATVYVNQDVDVQIKDVLGTAIRSWTETVGSELVEYIGQSFTGVDRDTAASATYEPVSLKAILDLWKTSSGSTDFSVLVGGAKTTLQTALANATDVFFNVKKYGATGDGITDDTTAIKAAVTAATVALGGVIYFPSGTYIITDEIALTSSHRVMGDARASSIIKGMTAGKSVLTGYIVASHVTLQHGTSATAAIIAATYAQIDYLILGGTNTSAALLTLSGSGVSRITNSVFNLYNAYPAISDVTTNGDAYLVITNCTIGAYAAFGGASFVTINRGVIANNYFVNTYGGTYPCILARSVVSYARQLVINNNNFISNDAAGTVTAIRLGTLAAADQVTENGNVFDSTITPYSYTYSEVYGVHLLSRSDRMQDVSGNGSSLTLDTSRYESFCIYKTDATTLELFAGAGLPGQKLHISLTGSGLGSGAAVHFNIATTAPLNQGFLTDLSSDSITLAGSHGISFIYRNQPIPASSEGEWQQMPLDL